MRKLAPMKYRSRMDIIAMVLQSANGGATKTRLMYSAYLSYAQLKEYLAFLELRELLTYEQGTQLYKLTEKGLHFLNIYDEVRELVTLTNEERNLKPSSSQQGRNMVEIRQ